VPEQDMSARVDISFACGPYDRTQALRDGWVKPEGLELNYLSLQPGEIFWRMLQFREFDACEMSMANYISLIGKGDRSLIGIPAFVSRVFRHGYIFTNTEKGIVAPRDLIGKRGGVPEYSQTSAVHIRGLLQHDYGVKPSDVEWVQGRVDRLVQKLPADIRISQAPPGVELGDMLERGEIDFLTSANIPLSFRRKSPRVARLFPNYREVERDYYARTKIYPIMHLVVIRRDIYEQHPWIALSLYNALCASKQRCFDLLAETGSPKASFAWLPAIIEEEQATFGADWYPYGVQQNRRSLEALLQFNYEQGLSTRLITIEELFAPNTLQDIPLTDGQRAH
jgi:4,5-dihydroxyphthalate decarboxylase